MGKGSDRDHIDTALCDCRERMLIDAAGCLDNRPMVESCTALVEHRDGRLELVHWHQQLAGGFTAPVGQGVSA